MRLQIKVESGAKTLASIGDMHYPFHDPKTIKLVEGFLYELQPDYVVYNGDIMDFYQMSVFPKDPSRLGMLQRDIKMTRKMFREHRKNLPNTELLLIEGTHEHHLQRYLWTKAAELSSLEDLYVPKLFHLDDFGIKYVPFEEGLLINGVFLILHGDIASVHSAYTAKRLFEKHGGCGLANHTHRLGSFYKRDRFGTWGWWENGCLCSLNPDWIQNPNWQQGFSLIHFTGSKRFWVEQIPIIDHEFMYGNRIWNMRRK